MDYYTRFGTSIRSYREELATLNDLPKKRKTKQVKHIKLTQTVISNLEEHEYFLEQLVRNKDLIDDEKIDNIREDMDNFLIHPSNEIMREELKAEYQHMFEDINQYLDEQNIEEQKYL
jgi:carbonic anhydrase